MTQFKFSLGETLREIITGLEGVVMARAEYFTGCIHYAIQPKKLTDKNEMADWAWIDEKRLVSTYQKIHFSNETGEASAGTQAKVGGPSPNPPSIG
jgi:hypothetical protein